jgi:hypothetical protein
MKTITFLLTIFAIPIFFISCTKDELNYADESIVIDNVPAISIYKTKGNYFDYLYVGIDSVENITMSPSYNSNDPRISIDSHGKVMYNQRWKLKSGYIVCKEMRYNDMAFTNITFQELIEYTNKNGADIPVAWFKSHIIDKDPFTEYYWLGGLDHPRKEFTLGQINKMIETGTLETIFTKIK